MQLLVLRGERRVEKLFPFSLGLLHFSIPFAGLLIPLQSVLADEFRLHAVLTLGGIGTFWLLYGWLRDSRFAHHAGIWQLIIAGGIGVAILSRGSGLSAAIVASGGFGLLAGQHLICRTREHLPSNTTRKLHRLYREPLYWAGWLITAAAIGAATIRNLLMLSTSSEPISWAIVTFLIVTLTFFTTACWQRQPALSILGTLTLFAAWTLLGYQLLPEDAPRAWAWFGSIWIVFAIALQSIRSYSEKLGRQESWQVPFGAMGQLLVPWSLLFALISTGDKLKGYHTIVDLRLSMDGATSSALGLAVCYYLLTLYRERTIVKSGAAYFLYPTAALLSAFVFVSLGWRWPGSLYAGSAFALLWLSVPMVTIGWYLERREPNSARVLYHITIGLSSFCLPLVLAGDTWQLTTSVFYLSGLAILATIWQRQPRWLYAATILFAFGIWLIVDAVRGLNNEAFVVANLAMATLFIVAGRCLQAHHLYRYHRPFLAVAIGLLLNAQFFSLLTTNEILLLGSLVSTGLLLLGSYWHRQTLLLIWATGTGAAAYLSLLAELNRPISLLRAEAHLWLLPLLIGYWFSAFWLDRHVRPVHGQKFTPFPWSDATRWWDVGWERLLNWWALPFYVWTIFGILYLCAYAQQTHWHSVIPLAVSTLILATLTGRFKRRLWLFLTALWAQWFALATIYQLHITETTQELLLAGSPILILTLYGAVVVGGRLRWGTGRFWQSWSMPLYILLGIDILIWQSFALTLTEYGAALTLINSMLVAAIATLWHQKQLTYVALTGFIIAAWQFGAAFEASLGQQVVLTATLGLLSTSIGFIWPLLRRDNLAPPPLLDLWASACQHVAWLLGSISLGAALAQIPLILASGQPVELGQTRHVILTLAELGLLFLFIATARRWLRLAYSALLLLLAAWALWIGWVMDASDMQLYVIPASVYLLGISWLEWEYGQKSLAIWVERMGVLVMLSSAFWQSFGQFGMLYAFIMMVEGLLLVWLGSWRRLRRLLYAGVLGVVLAVAGQLVEPLFELNTLVLLLLGGALVGLGISLERRLEKVRGYSKELRERMEHWE